MHIKYVILCFVWSCPEHLPPQIVGCLPFHALSGQLPMLRFSLGVVSNVLFSDCGVRSAVPLNLIACRFLWVQLRQLMVSKQFFSGILGKVLSSLLRALLLGL